MKILCESCKNAAMKRWSKYLCKAFLHWDWVDGCSVCQCYKRKWWKFWVKG